MKLPGFTAVMSIYRMTQHYYTVGLGVHTPKTCDSTGLGACLDQVQINYRDCFFRACTSKCTTVELLSQQCTSFECCACLPQTSGCAQTRVLETEKCKNQYGCLQGTICSYDINRHNEICCPLGTTACSGKCVSMSCISPKEFNTKSCQCECPPHVPCMPPLIFNSTTCGCECPLIPCQGGKSQDPITCQCVCPIGQTDACDGICRNLETDRMNCGTCGAVCPSGWLCCHRVCKEVQKDPDNCGKCDITCQQPGQGCCNSQCKWLNTSLNCGACGNRCVTGSLKSCKYDSQKQLYECQCPVGYKDCNGICKNLETDSENCGTCGNICDPDWAVGSVCQNGTCVCPAGLENCAGRCVNLQIDPQNCGTCGIRISGGSACDSATGICTPYTPICQNGQIVCPSRWYKCGADWCAPLTYPVCCPNRNPRSGNLYACAAGRTCCNTGGGCC